ncbi:MAG: FixH family protein [Trueperaceae bacterium]
MVRLRIGRRSYRERRSRSEGRAPGAVVPGRTTPRRFSLLLTLLLTLVPALVLAGCRPPSEASSASSSAADAPEPVRIDLEAPPAVGVVPVAVYVLDGSTGVSGATVRVTGDMTHAGMMPVEVDAVEVEPGLYRAESFAFSMAGDWILAAEVRYPDGRVITAEALLNVPSR